MLCIELCACKLKVGPKTSSASGQSPTVSKLPADQLQTWFNNLAELSHFHLSTFVLKQPETEPTDLK